MDRQDAGGFWPALPRGRQDLRSGLRYYATRFPIVEVDSSYYGMPSERNSTLWVKRTPESFVFDIKAFRLFTGHQTPPTALPADIRKALGTIDTKVGPPVTTRWGTEGPSKALAHRAHKLSHNHQLKIVLLTGQRLGNRNGRTVLGEDDVTRRSRFQA